MSFGWVFTGSRRTGSRGLQFGEVVLHCIAPDGVGLLWALRVEGSLETVGVSEPNASVECIFVALLPFLGLDVGDVGRPGFPKNVLCIVGCIKIERDGDGHMVVACGVFPAIIHVVYKRCSGVVGENDVDARSARPTHACRDALTAISGWWLVLGVPIVRCVV